MKFQHVPQKLIHIIVYTKEEDVKVQFTVLAATNSCGLHQRKQDMERLCRNKPVQTSRSFKRRKNERIKRIKSAQCTDCGRCSCTRGRPQNTRETFNSKKN